MFALESLWGGLLSSNCGVFDQISYREGILLSWECRIPLLLMVSSVVVLLPAHSGNAVYSKSHASVFYFACNTLASPKPNCIRFLPVLTPPNLAQCKGFCAWLLLGGGVLDVMIFARSFFYWTVDSKSINFLIIHDWRRDIFVRHVSVVSTLPKIVLKQS